MASSFTTEAFTLLGFGIVTIALRTVARTTSVGVAGFQFDDYLMLVAAVIYSLETATAYIVGAWWLGIANNGMTDEQRRTLDPDSHEYYLRVGGSKTQLVGWSLYTLLLWTLKLCMCHFYSRLTSGLYHLEIRVRIGYVLIACTYLATELSILLGCHPFHRNWQVNPDPGNYCQPAISKIDLYVTVVLNVTTDMYLMSIPMPMLFRANLGTRRKISLIVIFGGGVFVMMAGILRCVLVIKDPINGAQAAGSWACRETFVAVIINNAPMIYPFLRRGVDRIYSSSALSRYRGGSSRTTDPNNGAGGSYPLKSSLSKPARRGKLRSVNALPTTFNDYGDGEDGVGRTYAGGGGGEEGWDSKERIVQVVVDDDQDEEQQQQHQHQLGDDAASSSGMHHRPARGPSPSVSTGASTKGGASELAPTTTTTGGRSRSGSALSLGGIKVTTEAVVKSEQRTEENSRNTPSPERDGGGFKYRDEEGLEYTAFVGRGDG